LVVRCVGGGYDIEMNLVHWVESCYWVGLTPPTLLSLCTMWILTLRLTGSSRWRGRYYSKCTILL